MSNLKFCDLNIACVKIFDCDVCGKRIVFDDFDIEFQNFRDLTCNINYSFPAGFYDCHKELFLCSLSCLNIALFDVPFSCSVSIPDNRKYFSMVLDYGKEK